jgi:error-prone DNA polymerase
VIVPASLLACRGRVQREGEVIHQIAEHLIDLFHLLRNVSERNEPCSVPHGRQGEILEPRCLLRADAGLRPRISAEPEAQACRLKAVCQSSDREGRRQR